LKTTTLTAFGMTRRAGRSAANDPSLTAVLSANTPAVCLVGKTHDIHATTALGVDLDENLRMIRESVAECVSRGRETLFDAEHFFDGYKANPEYALSAIGAALEADARWVVLCDTNGGALPHEVSEIVSDVIAQFGGERIGMHAHNDTENAVANSIAAVMAGARHVQGTLNGLGERCGNANLVSLIPTLKIKLGLDVGISDESMRKLPQVSRMLDERLNRAPNRHAAYVGASAFAHKAGLHVSAVEKDPKLYEHVEPETVGNSRLILVSDQAGRANILSRFREMGIEIDSKDPRVLEIVDAVKQREYQGYSYDGAEASFELLARDLTEGLPKYFSIETFRVLDEHRMEAGTQRPALSEATVKISVAATRALEVAEGNGPVNALDHALRKALVPFYPTLGDVRLTDYRVRILNSGDGTAAVTRVMLESADSEGRRWTTVGLSGDIISASYEALTDGLIYKLMLDGVAPHT
jgi:2-isopropylmalate synthase